MGTQKCAELEATAKNLGISTVCNLDLGFCSIDCSTDTTTCQNPLLALVGITGLTCDSDKGYCTTDLRCSTSTDCTFSGFSVCAEAGICIPDTTNECVSINECTT